MTREDGFTESVSTQEAGEGRPGKQGMLTPGPSGASCYPSSTLALNPGPAFVRLLNRKLK